MKLQNNDLLGARLTANSNAKLPHSPERILFAYMDDELALSDDKRPSVSLLRAHALASELRAQLHVLAVTRPREPFAPVVPPSLTRALVTRWISKLLSDDAANRLHLGSGSFVSDVATTAGKLGAQLIVLVPHRRRVGRSVAKLVRRAAAPVLVAREPADVSPTIVAATDLADPSLPVLRQAATFGGALHAPVLAVHNMSPFMNMVQASGASRTGELARRTQQLQLAARDGVLGSEGAGLVDTCMSTTRAILRTATSRSASLVVVGAHTHRRYSHLIGTSLASRLVNKTFCSVLVTPIQI